MLRESITFFKSYNRNIKLLLLGNIFIQIGLGITAIIYNFYIRSLGYEDTMNGQVISLTSLATALFLLPAGIMGDRKGRKKILLFGLAAAGIFMLLRSVLESASLLLSIAFLLGGATAFFQVMVIPMLAENSTVDQRVHLFSFHFAITTAANVIGNLLGGFLTDVFKLLVEDITAIRLALLIGSIIFASAMIPFTKLAEPLKDAEQPPLLREPIGAGNRKIILIFFLSQLLIGTGSGLVIPYLNLYFADRFHASNSAIGLILSIGQAGTAIAMFVGPAVVKRFGEVKAVVLLQMLSLPFLLITAFTGNLFVASIAFLFRQALMNAGNPIQMSLMMSLVNDRSKGVANSANQMAFNLGWAFMGPVSTTLVVTYGSYWGYAAVFSITSFIYFIATLYFFFVLKAFTKKNTQVAMS
ncbi:MFS transporter [Rummeliibacillus sp. TYF-LIM-RU47]|uniref:MFS transporter n=1 Tax=Rummeliibacillus sp. TYF-LIM-RU47 TaxID=2608406 RepID=UPI00123BC049|nr:MFS transporter [Rummeliibacillus sp. TYF-LIM-RU47]